MNASTHTTRPTTLRRLFGVLAIATLGVAGLGATSANAAKPGTSLTAAAAGKVAPGATAGTFQLTGLAVSPQLGAASYSGSVTITDVDDTGVITDVLIETFTTARGDSLTIRCDQTATPVVGRDGVYVGTDSWTVIGGTGRYAGATGSGTGTTYVDLGAGTFSKFLTGSITTS